MVSEKQEMASFIQNEQCVNVAYLYGPLAINNNRMNCKHGMLQVITVGSHGYTVFVLAHADLGTAGLFTG